MKLQFAIVVVFASLLVLASVNIAQAQWSAINSGYAITTSSHGKDIIIGQLVVATAGTTNPAPNPMIHTVEFIWREPPDGNGPVATSETKDILGPFVTPAKPPEPIPDEIKEWADNNPGITYYYAQSSFVPNILGDWGVTAIFRNSIEHGRNTHIFHVTKATSFNVIPEVPFGTMVIILSMFGALGLFAIKKKQISQVSARVKTPL